jgi:DNA-binding MarR family transcriptional regulator
MHLIDICTHLAHVRRMTSLPPLKPPHFQQVAMAALRDNGFTEDAAIALMSLDADLFHHTRRVMKGDIPQSLLDALGTDLESTHFHALSALNRIRCGFGRAAPEEATVGLLAEELAVDPSRASRIASDLVDRGYLVRAVSQADGRRSVLEKTDKASALFEAFHKAKWQRTMQMFQGWKPQEIVSFARLFAKYRDGMAEQYPQNQRQSGEQS